MNEIKEMKKPVMAYEVCAKCPKCGGELIEGDNILLTEPLQYQYTCSKCDELFYATKSYPFIEFKSIDDVEERNNFSIDFHSTNGSVIMAIYPNAKILDNGTGLIKSNDGTDKVCVEVKIDNNILYFDKEWWNSPYLKRGDRDGTTEV